MWFLLALLSAVFAALTSILAKVGIDGVNSNLATAIRTIVVVAMAWGMVFLTNAQSGLAEISRKSWIFLILSGLATGASWLCYYRALQLGGSIHSCPHRQAKRCDHPDPGFRIPARKIHPQVCHRLPAHHRRHPADGTVK